MTSEATFLQSLRCSSYEVKASKVTSAHQAPVHKKLLMWYIRDSVYIISFWAEKYRLKDDHWILFRKLHQKRRYKYWINLKFTKKHALRLPNWGHFKTTRHKEKCTLFFCKQKNRGRHPLILLILVFHHYLFWKITVHLNRLGKYCISQTMLDFSNTYLICASGEWPEGLDSKLGFEWGKILLIFLEQNSENSLHQESTRALNKENFE